MLRRYVHGPNTGADTPLVWYEGPTMSQAAARMLNTDLQGSVTSVTDFNGEPVAINRYDEYGRPQSGNVGRFQYTGQAWLPEIGMYYYKARMYSPTLGRFMQTDPIGYADGVNWYNYVGGDPVNFVDPTGLETTINADGSKCVTTYHYHYSVYRNGRGIVLGPLHSDGSTTTCGGGDDGIVVRAAPRGGGPRGGLQSPNDRACKVLRDKSKEGKASLPGRVTDPGVWNDAGWLSAYRHHYQVNADQWAVLASEQAQYVAVGVGLLPWVRAARMAQTIGGVAVTGVAGVRTSNFIQNQLDWNKNNVRQIDERLEELAAGC